MALCPFAVKKLISPGSSDPRIDAIGAILHVDAGNAKSLFDFFRYRSGGIESHFHITNVVDEAGYAIIEQYRDTAYEADANYRANSFTAGGRRAGFVSIETQGYGAGTWSTAQLKSIKRLLIWLAQTHDFPLAPAPGPFSAGVGYHTMWGSPSDWTPVAKSCPGPERIVQFKTELVPWMRNPIAPVSKDKAKPTPDKATKPVKLTRVKRARVEVREALDLLKDAETKGKRDEPEVAASIKIARKLLRTLPKK